MHVGGWRCVDCLFYRRIGDVILNYIRWQELAHVRLRLHISELNNDADIEQLEAERRNEYAPYLNCHEKVMHASRAFVFKAFNDPISNEGLQDLLDMLADKQYEHRYNKHVAIFVRDV